MTRIDSRIEIARDLLGWRLDEDEPFAKKIESMFERGTMFRHDVR